MPAPPHAMEEALPLAMLTAVCAVAEGALPEREPHPRVFDGLLRLIPRLPLGDAMLTELIRWETDAAGRSRLRPRPVRLCRHRRGPRAWPTSRPKPAAR